MKHTRSAFFILIALFSLLTVTCFGPFAENGETGAFTIDFGMNSHSFSYPPRDIPPGTGPDNPSGPSIAELRYTVRFQRVDGNGTDQSFSFVGGQNTSGRVALGLYAVTMEINYIEGNALYARGVAVNNPVQINSGLNHIAVQVYDPVDALPPVIHVQPVGAGYDFSATAAPLTVTAVSLDGGNLTYQWMENSTNSTVGATPVGTSTDSFTPYTFGFQHKHMYYFVVITNTSTGIATVTSNIAQVSIVSAPVFLERTTGSPPVTTERPFPTLLAALNNTAGDGDNIIKIRDDQVLAPQSFTTSPNGRNITLIAEPPGSNVTIQHNGVTTPNPVLFSTASSTTGTVTLIMERGITLHGIEDNIFALIQIHQGGHLIMRSGSLITGNKNVVPDLVSGSGSGGAVSVSVNGRFTMEGGVISGNTARDSGGGVSVGGAGAVFTMEGGVISGNTAGFTGGGVNVSNNVTFNKLGGIITGYSNDPTNGNVVIDLGTGDPYTDRGHAVNLNSSPPRRRETTVTATQNLDWDGGGAAGTTTTQSNWDLP